MGIESVEDATVFVVDDDPSILQVIVDHLKALEVTTVPIKSGEAMFKLIQKRRPDLILLDIMMPQGMDGFEVCRHLKADEATRDIPVIFLTALTETVDRVKGFDLGATDYIPKPVETKELWVRVKTHLTLAGMREQLKSQNLQLHRVNDDLTREIAERKRAEAELREREDHLEELITKRTAELSQVNEVLQQEILERKRIEQALRESEQRLALALQASGAGVYDHFVPLEKGMYHSERWANILGYTAKELPPADQFLEWLLDQTHPDDLPRLERTYADFIEGRNPTYNVEIRLKHKSGAWTWVEGLSKAVDRDADGRVTRVVGIMLDITERKEAEEALKASEARFRRAVEESPYPIMIHAEDGEVIMISRSWTDIAGYSSEDIPTIDEWTVRAYDETRAQVRSGIQDLCGLKNRIYEGEFEIRADTGEKRVWDFSSSPLGKLPDGRRAAMSIAVDITERKKAEAELARHRHHLEELVRERTNDLDQSRQAALRLMQDANRQKQRAEQALAESKRMEAILAERLQFETLLSELSAAFVNLPASDVDQEIEQWLRRIAEFLGIDRCGVLEFTPDILQAYYVYHADGVPAAPTRITREQFPYMFKQLEQGEMFMFSAGYELPDEARSEKVITTKAGVKAHLSIPLQVGGTVFGVIAFGVLRSEYIWSDDVVQRLRLVSEIFANVLLRRKTEEELTRHRDHLEEMVAERTAELTESNERLKQEIADRKRAEAALQRHANRLEIQHEIEQGILVARSPKAIAQTAVARIRQLIPCQRVGVALFDFATDELLLMAVDTDTETKITEGIRVSLLETFDNRAIAALQQGKIFKSEKKLPLRDRIFDLMYAEGIRSTIHAPLIYQDELIGALNFGLNKPVPDEFIEEYEDIACQIADQLAIAIQQTRLQDQIQRHTEDLEQLVADRTRELAVLYEVTAIASEALDLQTTLARSLDRILVALKSDAGIIHLFDKANGTSTDGAGAEKMLKLVVQQGLSADSLPSIEVMPADKGLGSHVIKHGKPLIVSDVAADPRTAEIFHTESSYTYAGMPMRSSGDVVGMLSILREVTHPQFNVEELTLLTSIADQMGGVVESARLWQQAEQAAVMEERARLARELHDSVTQALYSALLLADAGEQLTQTGELEQAKGFILRLGDIVQHALKEMRLLIYELRPMALEQVGLVEALRERLETVERRAGVAVEMTVDEFVSLPVHVEQELYKTALEALNNALKHAQADSVSVHISAAGEQVTLEVQDNGRGFDLEAAEQSGGLGLSTMRERVQKLGGTLDIITAPGAGTRAKIVLHR